MRQARFECTALASGAKKPGIIQPKPAPAPAPRTLRRAIGVVPRVPITAPWLAERCAPSSLPSASGACGPAGLHGRAAPPPRASSGAARSPSFGALLPRKFRRRRDEATWHKIVATNDRGSSAAATLGSLRGAARARTHSPDFFETAARAALDFHAAARLGEVVVVFTLLRALVLLRSLAALGRRASVTFTHLAVDAGARFGRRMKRSAGRYRDRALRGGWSFRGTSDEQGGDRQMSEAPLTLISSRPVRHRQSTDQKHRDPLKAWLIQCAISSPISEAHSNRSSGSRAGKTSARMASTSCLRTVVVGIPGSQAGPPSRDCEAVLHHPERRFRDPRGMHRVRATGRGRRAVCGYEVLLLGEPHTRRHSAVCPERNCPSLCAFAIRRTATVRANLEETHDAWLQSKHEFSPSSAVRSRTWDFTCSSDWRKFARLSLACFSACRGERPQDDSL